MSMAMDWIVVGCMGFEVLVGVMTASVRAAPG
jgi:hypothetical protein